MPSASCSPDVGSPVPVATASYDPGWGTRSGLAFASGAESVWSTQADGIHLKAWSIQLPNGTKLDGDRLYNYDASKANLSQAGEWSLVHDHLGRLVGASASSLGNYSATYGYDAFDNNTSASVSGNTPPQAIGFTFGALPLNQTPGLTHPGGNQIGIATGWTYDAAGEATNFAAAPGSSSITGLQWDGLGRMSRVNAPGLTEQEGYAPSGLRVRRDESVASLSRRFVYTSGGLLLGEYIPKTGGGWSWKRDVVYLGSQAIAEMDGNGTHELHSDHLGTPRVITESVAGTATITGRQNYGPYGETFPAMDSGYVPLTGYTGHLQADPTGLIYMRGRFYTPIWHRFLNSDQGADPSTFNQMAYVGGSPMMAVDPSGMMAQTLCGYPPGATVTNRDTGETYTADSHGCITVGGGGASVPVTGGSDDWPIWMNPYVPSGPLAPPPIPQDPFGGGGTPPKPRPCNFLAWQAYLDNIRSILAQFQNATSNSAALDYYSKSPSSEPAILKGIEKTLQYGLAAKEIRDKGADGLVSVVEEEGATYALELVDLPLFAFPLGFGQVWRYMDGITNVNVQINAAGQNALNLVKKAQDAYYNQAIADCYGKH